MSARCRTSTNTSVSPSRMTRSSSPPLACWLVATREGPRATSQSAASRSIRAPRVRASAQGIAEGASDHRLRNAVAEAGPGQLALDATVLAHAQGAGGAEQFAARDGLE